MACNNSANLLGIGQDCVGSKGGLVEIWIAGYKSGLFTVSGDTCSIASGSTKEEDYYTDWKHFYVRKNTSSFTSTLNIDAANGTNYVSSEINLVFLRMSAAKRIQMNALMVGECAVIAKDANGKYWCFGVESPVTATAGEAGSGTQASDGNRYSITLTDECSVWPYELENADGLNPTFLDGEE